MKADEVFGVGVRLIGLIFVLSGLPNLLQLDYYTAAQVIAGLILVTRADSITRGCYPRHSRQEFMDSRDF